MEGICCIYVAGFYQVNYHGVHCVEDVRKAKFVSCGDSV